MKTTKSIPAWAVELVTQVCKDYNRKTPNKLQWYQTTDKHSSGFTYYDGSKLHVSAGTDEWEHKVVLLHELAHHIIAKSKKGRRAGHSIGFWRLLFELAAKYSTVADVYKRDVQMATEWRPGTRVKAVMAYDALPKK